MLVPTPTDCEENNTNAWKKLEEKEEECKSKLVLPQPPRLVKRARRRQVKFPERVEGQPEIKNFLKAAGGCQPKIPQEMLVPTPDCEANRRTGTEAKKRKKELVCDGDDVLEPSLKRTARQLRRKPSSCTEKLEEGTCTGKLEKGTSSSSSYNPRFSNSNLNTTVTRNVNIARFLDYSNYQTQFKECQKSKIMNISEKSRKAEICQTRFCIYQNSCREGGGGQIC